MNLTKTVPAVKDPVTLAEVKAFLKVTTTAEDTLITSLITSATNIAEKYLNRALITQTWTYVRDRYPSTDRFQLYYGPVQSVTSITSTLTDGSTYVFPSTQYFLASPNDYPEIVLEYSKVWDTNILRPADGVSVEYITGYGDDEIDVPDPIRTAILMIVANMFENRADEVIEIPAIARTMLSQYVSYAIL